MEPLQLGTAGLKIAEKKSVEARVVEHIDGSKAAEERTSVGIVAEHGTDALTMEPSIEDKITEERRNAVSCGDLVFTAIPDGHASVLVRTHRVEFGSESPHALLLLVLQLQWHGVAGC